MRTLLIAPVAALILAVASLAPLAVPTPASAGTYTCHYTLTVAGPGGTRTLVDTTYTSPYDLDFNATVRYGAYTYTATNVCS